MMKENYATFLDRKPLFPGHSCYLLSPSTAVEGEPEDEQKNDQLGKIFEVIGTPKDEEDLYFINEKKQLDYLNRFQKREKINFQEKYPGTDQRGLELLSRMLEFNPNKRITAEEALKDPYFDEVRIPE